jgi:hypothetical protein
MQENKRYVYILLSKTETIPAKIIRALKGDVFSHVSISLSKTTDKFYSFARRRIHNPLIAGFVVENIHTGVFGQYPDCLSALYCLEVSDESYNQIEKSINYFIEHYKESKYSFKGMFALAFGKRINQKNKYTCSQFVAHTLQNSNALDLPKDPYLMLPNDFSDIDSLKLIYKGPLKNCNYDALLTHCIQK